MKSKYLSIRAAVTAIGAMCCSIVLPSISHAAGGVSVNGSAVCASSTNMALNPAGDIVINCTAPGGPIIPLPVTSNTPVCSISISAPAIAVGQTTTISAVCNPAASSLVWTGIPVITGSGATFTFVVPGTFTYTVTGSNSAGTGPASAPASVVVTTATNNGNNGPIGCNAAAVAGAYAGNSTKLIAIDRGAKVAYALPVYNSPGRTLEILSIQSTASQSDLTSEFSVSTCPGDFDNMQAECKTWGTVNQSGTQLYATTSGSQVNGTCTVALGQQYYINVRHTKFDRATPACTPQTCYMNVQLNSY